MRFPDSGTKSCDMRTHLYYPYRTGGVVGGGLVGVWVGVLVGVLVGGGVLNLRTAFPKGSLVAEKTIFVESKHNNINVYTRFRSASPHRGAPPRP